jgi:methyl-accepting chemotaxis protein
VSDIDRGLLERLLPARIRGSYAAKFNVLLLAVVVVVAAAGGFIHLQTQQSVGEDTESEVSGIAEQQSASLHDWVTQKEATAQFLASDFGGDSVWASDVEPELERQLATLRDSVLAIHVVSTGTNSVVASTDDARSGASLSEGDVPWFGTITDGATGVAVSEPYRENGEPVFAVTAPTDKTGWVLVMTVSLADRSQSFNSPIATGDVKVVNGDGEIVFDNRNRALLEQYTNSDGEVPEAVATARNGRTVFEVAGERTGMEDGRYATAYTAVEGTDWVLTYHVPRSEAYALQTQVTEYLAGMVVIALVGLLLVGLTVGRRTSSALDELSGVASAVADGDLDTDVPDTDRTDELGELVDAFQGMQVYLGTAARQADALAEQNFDADVLDEDLPGSFGASLSQMHTRLEALITDLDEAREDAEQTRKEAEEARKQSERLNERLERRAAEYSDEMAAAAAGDLTRRLDEDADSEPMQDIAAAFNDMMDDVEATLSQVRSIADAVDRASTDVSTSSAEIRSASDQVSESVQDISADADQQRERLGTVGDEVTSLSATVEEIAASADDVAETVDGAAAESERGRELGEDAVAELERIEATADSAVERVNALEEAVDAIGEVTGVITDIAEQTNMLALNANIEAARADKDGDGFAVVADEVKDLADETKESAAEIEGLVEDVQDDVEATVEDMADLGERVDAGSETIEAALSALDDIGGRVEEANASVQSISEATDEQAASTEEVVTMIDEVEDLSDRTATEAQQVSAAAEEQAASVSEVAGLADDLDGQVSELNELLAEFETREAVGDDVNVAEGEESDEGGPDADSAAADGGYEGDGEGSGDADGTDETEAGDDPDAATDGGFEFR